MKFYQEITLIPDENTAPYFLWSKVYTQLHLALANVKNQHGIETIGVSFPQYKFDKSDNQSVVTLGNKLRVFAPSENELLALNLPFWLNNLMDYLHLKSIQSVPEKHGFAVFSRCFRRNIVKVAKRFAEHKGIGFDEALEHCKKNKVFDTPYPFISLNSQTQGTSYRLYVKRTLCEVPNVGRFNSYGLNNLTDNCTVPVW